MRYITGNDIRIICHYLGMIMQGVGVVLLVPLLVAFIYQEGDYLCYAIPCLISIVIGTFFNKYFEKHHKLRLKHGMIVSSIAWLWAAFIGALIMMMCLDISLVNAFFENISAWTGSGFTFFPNVEILPHSILFLRSLEEWIGGLGIVVIFIGIIIRSGTSAARLYKSEARDEKIKPSITNTLRKSLTIYVIYTVIGIIAFILLGLPIFDAVNLSLTSISTGGMSIKNANVGYYQNYLVYIVTMILMILGATSFAVHYKVIKTKGKTLFRDIQFQTIIVTILVISTLILLTTSIAPMDVIFHVTSAITSTGASISPTADISLWPGSTLILLFILMAIGGSSGSTAGGLKIVRILTALKGINLNIRGIISPEGRVIKTKIAGRILKEAEIKEATTYISLYMMFLAIGWFILVLYGADPLNSLFDIISAQSNNGLSTGIIIAELPGVIKLVLIFEMWIGRLEIIPVLVIIRSLYEFIKPSNNKKSSTKTKTRKNKVETK
ncbi:MAG: TrkH family potassium uptake protein [Methanobacteriaceae archaeon]|nr:TrkH family potassium uptake protein [Methanobacteriaceae archaeon]